MGNDEFKVDALRGLTVLFRNVWKGSDSCVSSCLNAFEVSSCSPSNFTPSHVNKGFLKSERVQIACLDRLINNSQVGQGKAGGRGLRVVFIFRLKK
jgi:hypothetical protein